MSALIDSRKSRLAALFAEEQAQRQLSLSCKDELVTLRKQLLQVQSRTAACVRSLKDANAFLRGFARKVYESFGTEVVLPPEILKMIFGFYARAEGLTNVVAMWGDAWRFQGFFPDHVRCVVSILDLAFARRVGELLPCMKDFLTLARTDGARVSDFPGWKNYIKAGSLRGIASQLKPIVIRTACLKVTLLGPRAMVFFECKHPQTVLSLLSKRQRCTIVLTRWDDLYLRSLKGKGCMTTELRLYGDKSGFGLPWPGPGCRCEHADVNCRLCHFNMPCQYVFNTRSKSLIAVPRTVRL